MKGSEGGGGGGIWGGVVAVHIPQRQLFPMEELAISDLCFPSLFRGGR